MAREGPLGPGWKATADTAEVTSFCSQLEDFKQGSEEIGARGPEPCRGQGHSLFNTALQMPLNMGNGK